MSSLTCYTDCHPICARFLCCDIFSPSLLLSLYACLSSCIHLPMSSSIVYCAAYPSMTACFRLPPCICTRLRPTVTSIWFEIWEVVDPGPQNFDFSRQISEKFRFSSGKFLKNFNFFKQICEKFRFFHVNFKKILIFSWQLKKIDFPGKSCSFTATSEQIIPFLFKCHYFRTYFLYMIIYNNISRPVHDPPRPNLRHPHDPPAQNLWGCDPHPQTPGLTPLTS